MARKRAARVSRRQLVQPQVRRESAPRPRPWRSNRASLGLEGSKRRKLADLPGWEGSAEMTGTYQAVGLPNEARRHLEERLLRGGALGRSLARRLREGRWSLWTIAPAGSAFKLDRSLDEGGVASAKETRSWLSARIGKFLERREGRIAFFENDMARKGDEWLRACGSKIAYSGERVLHYACFGDSAIEVERVIRDAQSPHLLVGALIESSAIEFQRDLSDDDLSELASSAVVLIADAFDGESYVVAEPDGSAFIALQ